MKTDYFINTEGLEKLLTDYKDIFEMIEDYGQQLVQGIISTPSDYKSCLDKLTGAYITLEPMYAVAESVKLNEELKKYMELKRNLEGLGEKVVASSLDKEASLSVASFRRVRAVLEGYVEACTKGIGTCQTQLKRIEFEMKIKNE